jgi:Zn-dependent peptidase ImmA (M78 family)/transcriptional regulator with XRE-family HTH domain
MTMTMTIPSSQGTEQGSVDFSPERLTIARETRGLTKQELANLCDVSRRTVTSWERGDIENPPVDLIAEKLGFPVEYFRYGDPATVNQESVSFRALSSTTARQVHAAMAAASIAIEFSEWIERRYRLPQVAFPDIDDSALLNPVLTAEGVRSLWQLRPGPIANMFSTLEKRGVRIFSLPDGDREIDAFSFWRGGKPFVFLNPDRTPERQRFDLAHELGHLVLHRDRQLGRSRTVEQEAHDFASAFLMPADAIYPQVIDTLRYEDVFKLKDHWRVSAMAMVERLWRLDLITEWIRRRWIIELTQQGYRSGEPDGIPKETSRLLREILDRAREDGWMIQRIAKSVRVEQADLNNLVFGLGHAVIVGSGEAVPRASGHLRRVQ